MSPSSVDKRSFRFAPAALLLALPGLLSPSQAGREAVCLDLVVLPQETHELKGDERHECVFISALGAVKTNDHTLTITGSIGLNCLGTLTINDGGTAVIAASAGLSCAGTINIEDGGTLVLAGGTYTAIAGTIRLMGDDSLLHVSGDTTLGDLLLAGKIIGEHPDATIQINEDITLTSWFDIKGAMTILGPGTLDNRDTISAQPVNNSSRAVLTLGSDLRLAGTNGVWEVFDDATLEFHHPQTGDAKLDDLVWLKNGGTLKILASIDFDKFFWDGSAIPGLASTLIVATDQEFTFNLFWSRTGSCSSPGSGNGPFVVGAGTYTCPQ